MQPRLARSWTTPRSIWPRHRVSWKPDGDRCDQPGDHAAINTADAATGMRMGRRASGQDHDQVLTLLHEAGKDGSELEADLARLLPLKTRAGTTRRISRRPRPRGQSSDGSPCVRADTPVRSSGTIVPIAIARRQKAGGVGGYQHDRAEISRGPDGVGRGRLVKTAQADVGTRVSRARGPGAAAVRCEPGWLRQGS